MITQTELAEKLEVPQSFIAKTEKGERRLDVIEFLSVASALKVDASAFISDLSKKLRK